MTKRKNTRLERRNRRPMPKTSWQLQDAKAASVTSLAGLVPRAHSSSRSGARKPWS